ncbi:hypothetical protein [Caloranaerobacter azorensis]
MEYKAKESGIEVQFIDESYTAKVSSLTDNYLLQENIFKYVYIYTHP